MIKSVYRYSAEAGLPIGIYLTAMSACFLLSLRFPVLPMLLFPLALVFPVLLGFYMRRMARETPAYRKLSALWLFGIYAVIFGTLICSLFSAVYLVAIDPDFIPGYVASAISSIESSPMASDYAETTDILRRALDSHMLPSGMQFVMSAGWLTCFAGSMLSLALAGIFTIPSKRKTADIWR